MSCHVTWHVKCHFIFQVLYFVICYVMSCLTSYHVIFFHVIRQVSTCWNFYLDYMTLGWDSSMRKSYTWVGVFFSRLKMGQSPSINYWLHMLRSFCNTLDLQITRWMFDCESTLVSNYWSSLIPVGWKVYVNFPTLPFQALRLSPSSSCCPSPCAPGCQ